MPDTNETYWRRADAAIRPPMPPGVGPVTPLPLALLRGLRGRCPGCGKSRIFNGYLTIAGPCPVCATPLNEARADDAPPYFTILIAAHVIVPVMLLAEEIYTLGVWTEAAIFVPLTVAVTVGLLRPVKGATVALMLRLNMLKPVDAV